MTKQYNVGIYTRLSVDDASNSAKARGYIPADESVSIENQKTILSQFAHLSGWIVVKTYVDDGYSGGNFDRPGFREMLKDVQRGKINLVLVKDLSRFGRDYVEVGHYTDAVFPALGCRFVSLLDCIDTASDNNEMMHFRSLMNDYHLKDLSNKIKSVKLAKMKSGQYIGSCAPYGYRKSPEDKHVLLVDEYAAQVVQRIFQLREEGTAYGKIAAALNEDGILSPRAYWYQQCSEKATPNSPLWQYATVKNVLHNDLYAGRMTQNRTGSLSYKNKALIKKPESEWVCHEGLHPALITQEQWDTVQRINLAVKERHSGRRPPTASLFQGKLVCADCGTNLVASTETQHRKSGETRRYTSYICSKYTTTGHSACSWHRIFEITLKKLVLQEMASYADAIETDETAMLNALKKALSLQENADLQSVRQEAASLKKRLAELDRQLTTLYEDKVSHVIS
ncbi:MAG: recombinase family protein, partial [Oscillospiraceae bacterium]